MRKSRPHVSLAFDPQPRNGILSVQAGTQHKQFLVLSTLGHTDQSFRGLLSRRVGDLCPVREEAKRIIRN